MGRFVKGQSGNPKGRPAGIPNPLTKLRQQIADDAPEIIKTMVASAKAGDVSAASLLLSRVIPPVRAESPAQELPDAGSMTERAEQIVTDVMAGNLSPTSAGELMAVLANQARIIEVADLEERIAALEARAQ